MLSMLSRITAPTTNSGSPSFSLLVLHNFGTNSSRALCVRGCRGIILTALQCFARNVTHEREYCRGRSNISNFQSYTNSRICTQIAMRVRYTTVNLRPTASARNFLPQALLRGSLPRRRPRLHPFLYSRRVYFILRGISTLMYRVRQATVLYVWPSEAPTTQASMFSARYRPREQRNLENL